MTDNRMAGLAMIAGSAGVIITLGLHPSGHGLFAPETYDSAARTLIAVHSLALATFPVWFLGACGLSRRLDAPAGSTAQGRWGFCGLVLYGFALASMMTGVVLDGLVTPGIARKIIDTTGTAAEGWKIALRYNGILDESFVRVFLVGSSVAIVLWSAAIIKNAALARGVGIFGAILGVATVAAQLSGQLDRSPHMFGMVLVGQAVWFVVAGSLMMRIAEISNLRG